MRYQLYAEASYDHNFIPRWVELLIQGPRPLVLEASSNSGMHDMLMRLLSKKGGEELTEKWKESIRDILSNTSCMEDKMRTLLRSVDITV